MAHAVSPLVALTAVLKLASKLSSTTDYSVANAPAFGGLTFGGLMRRFKIPIRRFRGIPLSEIAGAYLTLANPRVGQIVFYDDRPNLILDPESTLTLQRRFNAGPYWSYARSKGLTPRLIRQIKRQQRVRWFEPVLWPLKT